MFQTKFVEKIKYILGSVTFFFENPVDHEIMLNNTVQQERPQVTVWCIFI